MASKALQHRPVPHLHIPLACSLDNIVVYLLQHNMGSRMVLPTPAFVPLKLESEPADDDTLEDAHCVEESAEEAAARRKQAAFVGTRERPHELQNWLDDAGLVDG